MEKTLENRFKREVEKHGGLALKFVSPGMAGVPDRIVLQEGGKAVFAELKAEGKTMRPLQLKRAKQLQQIGFRVYCIDSIQAIEQFIKEVFPDAV